MNKICKKCILAPTVISKVSTKSLTQGGSSGNICCFCKFLRKNTYSVSLLPYLETPAYSLVLSFFRCSRMNVYL